MIYPNIIICNIRFINCSIIHVIYNNSIIFILLFIIWNYNATNRSTLTQKNQKVFTGVTHALSINQLTYRPPYIPETEIAITSPSSSSLYVREIMPKKRNQQQQQQQQSIDGKQIISSKCQCGSLEIQFPATSVTTASLTDDESTSSSSSQQSSSSTTCAADCHCPSCRRYHIAAFVSYLQVPKQDMNIIDHSDTKTSIGTYRDTCSGSFGIPGASSMPVNRIYCKHCSTKMYTEPIPKSSSTSTTNNDLSNMILVNMGSLRDSTIPNDLSKQWKQQKPFLQPLASSPDCMEERIEKSRFGRIQWKVSETAAWTWSLPNYDKNKKTSDLDDDDDEDDDDEVNHRDEEIVNNISKDNKQLLLKGGCTCGACRFEIKFNSPSELQHCYCRLCRRLSGSAFMTWIPIQLDSFRWTFMIPISSNDNQLHDMNQLSNNNNDQNYDGNHILKRYTDHGQRHVCTECHGALTIVYDDDADTVIWIAAGTLDSIDLPSTYKALDMYLDRVVHICCQSKQSWYTLPNDGMVRLNGAS